MLRDPEEMAELVVQAIDTAIGPVLQRLAGIDARLSTLGDVRDRVVALETKTASPPPLVNVDAALTPLLERMAGMEFKAERITLTERAVAELGHDTVALRERAAVLETRAPVPDLAPITAQLAALDTRVTVTETQAAAIAPLAASVSALTTDVGTLRERAAVLETRAPVPGPAGQDGQDGKDGADGLGFDDLIAVPAGERGVTVRAVRGEQTKDIGTITFPVEIYRGVWLEGKAYERGDGVTWGGSEWHCHEPTTTKPGDGSKAWTLKVKRGRDGKDGRDAAPTVPVVSIGGRP